MALQVSQVQVVAFAESVGFGAANGLRTDVLPGPSSVAFPKRIGVPFEEVRAAMLLAKQRQTEPTAARKARLAEQCVLRGDYARALKAADRALELNPRQATGLVSKGIALLKLGRESEALDFAADAFEEVDDVKPVMAYIAATSASLLRKPRIAAHWLARAIEGDAEFVYEAIANPIFEELRARHPELYGNLVGQRKREGAEGYT